MKILTFTLISNCAPEGIGWRWCRAGEIISA